MRHHHFLNFEEKSRAFLVDIRDRTSSAVNLTERKIPTLPHFSPLFSYRGFAFFYSKDVLKVWWLYSNGVHIYRVNNTIQYWRRIKNWNPPDQTKIHTEISPQLYYMEKNPLQYIWHRFYVEEDEMTRLIPSCVDQHLEMLSSHEDWGGCQRRGCNCSLYTHRPWNSSRD